MLDKIFSKIASWLPRKLVYFCSIRLMVNATSGKNSKQIVGDISIFDALDRWE